jgi:hypothetical protein
MLDFHDYSTSFHKLQLQGKKISCIIIIASAVWLSWSRGASVHPPLRILARRLTLNMMG